MRLVRGRGADPEADREATRALLDSVADGGESVVRAWTPHRQLAFGRRDARAEGYQRAREAAREHGFPPRERSVGGHAVAYTGSTVAFAIIEPIPDLRTGLTDRYEAAVGTVVDALRAVGVDASAGEPAESFCPGDHSVRVGAGDDAGVATEASPAGDPGVGKVAGIAQRVKADAAIVAGCVVVDGADEIATVLEPVYGALEVPLDPTSVGSVAGAGVPTDPDQVARAIEDAFGDGRETRVVALDG